MTAGEQPADRDTDAAAAVDRERGYDICGGPKRQSDGVCTRPAGWGTPHPGTGRCKLHGGSTQSHVKAAQAAQAQALVDRKVRALWPGLADAAPVKDPVASLERLAGALEQLVDESGRRVTELQNVAGGEHLTQLRAEVVLLERALGHLRGVLVDMARLGIAERHVQLEQERAGMVTAAFLAALDVGGLVPEVRTAMVDRFVAGLGELMPPASGATVAGDVVA